MWTRLLSQQIAKHNHGAELRLHNGKLCDQSPHAKQFGPRSRQQRPHSPSPRSQQRRPHAVTRRSANKHGNLREHSVRTIRYYTGKLHSTLKGGQEDARGLHCAYLERARTGLLHEYQLRAPPMFSLPVCPILLLPIRSLARPSISRVTQCSAASVMPKIGAPRLSSPVAPLEVDPGFKRPGFKRLTIFRPLNETS